MAPLPSEADTTTSGGKGGATNTQTDAEPGAETSALRVRVADLTDQPKRIVLEADAVWWTAARELFPDLELDLIRPFRLELDAYRLGRRLLFRGDVSGEVELPCGRCIDRFRLPLETRLELLLEPFPEGEGPPQAAIELDPEDLEVGRYAGEELDFDPVLRDLLRLSWPMAPRCADDCQGLCPRCGANRNREPCQCDPEEGNKPFAGLGKLLEKSRKDGAPE